MDAVYAEGTKHTHRSLSTLSTPPTAVPENKLIIPNLPDAPAKQIHSF